MISNAQISQLATNLSNLGARRLALLGIVGVLATATIIVTAIFLARPAMEPLYNGLSPQDVGRMSAALAEAGIAFEIDEKRTSISVPSSDRARARILLAKEGLPAHETTGYELFDQLGSLGLTSFMQEVTRLRALEGEIARTIQAIDGVEAARVHLVLADPGSFRRKGREPSASVVVRIGSGWQPSTATTIRHIVAAAVAGMTTGQVSVASSSGEVLVSGSDERDLASNALTRLQEQVARELEAQASRTLTPILGVGNFQISMSVKLDIDRQRIAETTFDPDSRVERSVRVVRHSNLSENSSGNPAVGVEANIPNEAVDDVPGDSSRRKDDKREETTNYEINSRQVETERQGYRLERLTVAAVLNRNRLLEALGGDANQEQLQARLDELRRLIAAATGFNEERGDQIEISAIPFDSSTELQSTPGPGAIDYLAMNAGTIAGALALVLISALLFWLVLKPAIGTIAREASSEPTAIEGPEEVATAGFDGGFAMALGQDPESPDQFISDADLSPRERLAKLVDENEAKVATVLKQWLREAERT